MTIERPRPRLLASWQRSEAYGVSPERVEPAFTEDVDTGSLLYECGKQVLTALHASLANEPVSLMIADSDGLVLTRLASDSAIVRSLDRVHLAPGFSYAEREAGTNGLGLSLADRAPTLVRAEEHYCEALQGYTCAAVPVLDPVTGALAGSVNLTTWSDASSGLLLALAQAAADNTSSLMLLRATGRRSRPTPRGEVTRVQVARSTTGDVDPCRSRQWREALTSVRTATGAGRVVAMVGERGVGKRALVTRARRLSGRRERVLLARPPASSAAEIEAWLALWTPELRDHRTCVIVSGLDTLPAWAASEVAACFGGALRSGGEPQSFVLTATSFEGLPEPLPGLVDTVVEVAPLRNRPDDVIPLARHFARRQRRREVAITPRARQALTAYHWPENAAELERVMTRAAARADVVDVQHLPGEVFSGPDAHRLGRLEQLERDEIVRCLTEPGATMTGAARTLGVGRATLYRKMAQFQLTVPSR